MSKNVAVFVDVANIFYAAKAAGVDIDYVTLLKAAVAGRDFVRAYAYTGLDPENESQRNFQQFLARNSYRVISKDIRKYGDGRVKANLDIEMVVDMMKTARNLDVAVLVSGDGDFAPAIRAVQEMGVRVEVICFRANTSSDLIDVADQFIEITQIAKVDKGSVRSGRRVAGDEEDLSMTAVPEKQTEGATERRRRTRARAAEAEKVEKVERPARRTAATTTRSRAAVTVLPGEKLSRAAAAVEAEDIEVEELEPADLIAEELPDEEPIEGAEPEGDATDATLEGGPRRRRRRRGRGRGRGREAGTEAAGEDVEVAPIEEAPEPPRRRSPNASFGSVWDSQMGVPSAPRSTADLPLEEDLDEPEVPEYLLAERRGRDRGRGGGGGRRDAYRSAIDRERYGRGGSGRSAEPRSGWGRDSRREQPSRPPRSTEGWSEVPPEIEAMLMAQLGSKGGPTPTPTARRDEQAPEPKPARRSRTASTARASDAPEKKAAGGTKPPRQARSSKPAATAAPETIEATASAEAGSSAKPARRTRSTSTAKASTAKASTAKASTAAPDTGDQESAPAKPARRTRSKSTSTD